MSSTSQLQSNAGLVSIEGTIAQTADGVQFDLTTEAGAAGIQGVLTQNELAELEGLMKANGYELSENRWIPSDSVMTASELAAREETRAAITGAQEVSAGMDDVDADLAAVFAEAGVAFPFNSNTTPVLDAQTAGDPTRIEAASSFSAMVANGAAAGTDDFVSKMTALEQQFPSGNVMELLYLVFRDSIKQTNEDKKYFLTKLKEYNAMAEALSDYLSELVDESQNLSSKAAGAKYPEKVTIPVTVKKFDTTTVDASGKGVQIGPGETKTLDRAGLNDTIKDVESMQETVRNKRQMTSTAFQNFDQKSNQLYNMMASVLKVMNEMRSSTVRNML